MPLLCFLALQASALADSDPEGRLYDGKPAAYWYDALKNGDGPTRVIAAEVLGGVGEPAVPSLELISKPDRRG